MRIFILYILFCTCIPKMLAQNTCRCNSDEQYFHTLDDILDQKDFEAFDFLAKKINYKDNNCKNILLTYICQKYSLLNQFNKADSLLNDLEVHNNTNNCKYLKALISYQKGFKEYKFNEFEKSLQYLYDAKKISVEIKDTALLMNSIITISSVFNQMQQPHKAIEIIREALQISKTLKRQKKEIRIYSNMQGYWGICFDLTEDPEKEKMYLDSAKKTAAITLVLAKKNKLLQETAQTYSVLAGIAWGEENFKTELVYCDSALMYLDRNKDFRFLSSVFYKKGDAYMQLKDYNMARKSLDSCLKYAMLEENAFSISNYYERSYELEKLNGNYKKALEYHEIYNKIRDSLRSDNRIKTINELEQKYNKLENEKKIGQLNFEKENLNKQTEIDLLRIRSLIGIIAAVVLLLLVIIFFYRQSVIKNKLKTIETEQRLNRSRMNPHFFFNALTSVQTLAANPENSSKVVLLVSRFSKIMRQALESTYHELVSIEEEMLFLTNYLELQKLRYPNKFEYELKLDEELDPTEIKVPGMLLQPFIENSIEHGFKNIEHKGFLTIEFRQKNKNLIILLNDNGVGLKNKMNNKKEFPSRASQIIADRLHLLNVQYKSKAKFEILEPETGGVNILLELPILT